MILHTLNAAPSSSGFCDCVRFIQPGDAVVLLGDGVYAALEGTDAYNALRTAGAELFLLSADAEATGIAGRTGTVAFIDMDGLVALTERLPRQQAWY
jgi:tRNA 2-thiouridine synthesizing protein B